MWTCKPQNRVPGGGVKSGGKLTRYLCLLGSRARVAPAWNILRGGAMFHESGVGCSKPHFAISLPGSHLAVVDRQASAAPAGTSGTEATPPLLPLVRHAVGGACSRPCSIPCTPPLGVASVQFIPAGRLRTKPPNTNPQLARNSPKENPMKWRYPVLIFGGVCCSAWGFI